MDKILQKTNLKNNIMEEILRLYALISKEDRPVLIKKLAEEYGMHPRSILNNWFGSRYPLIPKEKIFRVRELIDQTIIELKEAKKEPV